MSIMNPSESASMCRSKLRRGLKNRPDASEGVRVAKTEA